MSAPADRAFAAAADALAQRLVDAGFLAAANDLQREPTAPFEPDEQAEALTVAAAIYRLQVSGAQVFMGGAGARYVVEIPLLLELAAFGPDPAAVQAALGRGQTALAPLTDPLFDWPEAAIDRLEFQSVDLTDAPPAGAQAAVRLVLHVNAADQLARTALP